MKRRLSNPSNLPIGNLHVPDGSAKLGDLKSLPNLSEKDAYELCQKLKNSYGLGVVLKESVSRHRLAVLTVCLGSAGNGLLPYLNSGSNDLLHILKPSAEAPEKLRVLLAAGANPSAKDEGGHFAMEIFSLRGYYSLVQALHKQTGFARLNNSLIMCCWRRSHFVGRHGSRPLRESHSAASGHDWNFVKTIKYLLCAKAEFANPTLTWNATDGSFLLRGCVWARHSVEALDLLLDHNAEIDGKSERARHQELDTGATVLHCAASDDRLDLVQRLLVRRADANSIDKAGRTPLMRAMDNANWFVSLVLSKFTDPRHMTKTMITCMNQKKDTVIATTNAIATSTSLPRCICDIISEYNIHSGFDTESSEE